MAFEDYNKEANPAALPRVTDLAVLTDRMGDALIKLSDHMNRNALTVQTAGQRKTGDEEGDHRLRDHRLRIRLKHVFDATRYLSALNQILACIIIPLGDSPPRRLAWRPNPVQQNRPNR